MSTNASRHPRTPDINVEATMGQGGPSRKKNAHLRSLKRACHVNIEIRGAGVGMSRRARCRDGCYFRTHREAIIAWSRSKRPVFADMSLHMQRALAHTDASTDAKHIDCSGALARGPRRQRTHVHHSRMESIIALSRSKRPVFADVSLSLR